MSSSDEENYSDVSLDEDDEELIWRVFYSALESKGQTTEASSHESDDLNKSLESDTEISDLSDIDDEELVQQYKSLKNGTINKSMTDEEKQRLLISNLTESQMEKFEAYRRMTVNKPGVKKICNGVLSHSIPQNIAVVLAGLSKLFLSEIITRSFEIQERNNKAKLIMDIDNKKKQKNEILKSLANGNEVEVDHKPLKYNGDIQTPLQPDHIREAWRLYKLENSSSLKASWREEGDSNGRMFR